MKCLKLLVFLFTSFGSSISFGDQQAYFSAILSNSAQSNLFPKVDSDISAYDQKVEQLVAEFRQTPADLSSVSWVQLKLGYMFEIDQLTRKQIDLPFLNNYTPDELEYFRRQFTPRFQAIDFSNTQDLKELLKIYDWFRISKFGASADKQAWLIVQHADMDPGFQKSVLKTLEQLWSIGETNKSNYAYLYDRVAASWHDPAHRTLQRYGTQGNCTGPGTWEPLPIEDELNLDSRRAEMGLTTQAEYVAQFKMICH